MMCAKGSHGMAAFRRASQDSVNAFAVDETYLFKEYFETDAVFARLKQYYNGQQYRFEVPAGDFVEIREFLGEYGYGLVVVDAIEEFVVVVRKYRAHPDNIFRHSVAQRSVDDYNCFLLTDQGAVEQAINEGATRLIDTELDNPF